MEILKNPIEFLKTLKIVGWAEKSIILLVMQTCDSSFQMRLKRSWWCPWKKSLKSVGKRVPPFIEPANLFAEKMAQRFQGKSLTALTEIFFNVPTTAHILGGSIMGKSSSEGVIDSQNRVFHYNNCVYLRWQYDWSQPGSEPQSDHHGTNGKGDESCSLKIRKS